MALSPVALRLMAMGMLQKALGISEEPADETISVNSSCISQIGYRKGDIIMVTFHRGGSLTYDFPGDYNLYTDFKNAESKGKFFNANFK